METQYKYQAVDKKGHNYSAYISAENKEHAYQKLRTMGLLVYHLEKINVFTKFKLAFEQKLPPDEFIFFFRQLSLSIKSGISLQAAITLQLDDNHHKRLKRFLNELEEMLNRGFSFSESLRLLSFDIPFLVYEWIMIGENEGNLAQVLDEIADYLEKEYAFKREIKNQMLYPMIILGMIVLFLVLLAVYFLPMLESAYMEFGIELPTSLVIFLKLSMIVKRFSILFLVLLLGMIYCAKIDYKGYRTKVFQGIEKLLMKSSYFKSLIMLYYFVPFIRAFGVLLNSGISMMTIFSILMMNKYNKRYLTAIESAKDNVLSGKRLIKAFEGTFFIPPSAYGMLSIADSSGNLSEACHFLATYYEKLQKEKMKKLAKVLEPVMIIFLGLIVLFLALAFYIPIISSYETFFNV